MQIIPNTKLYSLDIGWLSLKDHFISTVGPQSGSGNSLGNILVMADATIKGLSRFPMHPHKDMEILTWVTSGTLSHKDDIGGTANIPTHSLQLMSARDGIYHAEGNDETSDLRIIQIWIRPNVIGGQPVFKTIKQTKSGFELLAGPEKASLIIRQNLWLYTAILNNQLDQIEIPQGHSGYAVVIDKIKIEKTQLIDGDGVILPSGTFNFYGQGQVILLIQPD